MASEHIVGVIGGSGLYDLAGLSHIERITLSTPFGAPSDSYLTGRLGDLRVVFLPRHGSGHLIPPHQINYRANIHGMKQLGVEFLISVSAVGSMKEAIKPGDLVLVDQFIDRTKDRPCTFFEDGIAGHIQFAKPICHNLLATLYQGAQQAGVRVHRGGTYICIQGPQFSTRAESDLYRSWGVSVIGMTNLPEAKLAREAEICYATIALATDYDCWHESGEVSVEAVIQILNQNIANAKLVIQNSLPHLPASRDCQCASAAQYAVLSNPSQLAPAVRERLSLLIGKYIKS